MAFPAPEPGLVISYSYLWQHEYEAGLEEGLKTRPCVNVLSVERYDDAVVVTVAPITHRKPAVNNIGLEVPLKVKRHLGLDCEKSWIILSEVNQFVWPGYDLRPIIGNKHRIDYGFLPPKLFEKIKQGMLDLVIKRRTSVTRRD